MNFTWNSRGFCLFHLHLINPCFRFFHFHEVASPAIRLLVASRVKYVGWEIPTSPFGGGLVEDM